MIAHQTSGKLVASQPGADNSVTRQEALFGLGKMVEFAFFNYNKRHYCIGIPAHSPRSRHSAQEAQSRSFGLKTRR